jgi:hypothetical protein
VKQLASPDVYRSGNDRASDTRNHCAAPRRTRVLLITVGP